MGEGGTGARRMLQLRGEGKQGSMGSTASSHPWRHKAGAGDCPSLRVPMTSGWGSRLCQALSCSCGEREQSRWEHIHPPAPLAHLATFPGTSGPCPLPCRPVSPSSQHACSPRMAHAVATASHRGARAHPGWHECQDIITHSTGSATASTPGRLLHQLWLLIVPASAACPGQGTGYPLACLQPGSGAGRAGGTLPRAASPSHPTAWDPSNTKLISNHG